MRIFDTGATRDDDTNKLDYEGFLSPLALRAFAEYMHKHRMQADGKLRASDNWQKGIPEDALMKSLIRHIVELWQDYDGVPSKEGRLDTLCAVLFNVQALILHEVKKQANPVGPPPPPTKNSTDLDWGAIMDAYAKAQATAHEALKKDSPFWKGFSERVGTWIPGGSREPQREPVQLNLPFDVVERSGPDGYSAPEPRGQTSAREHGFPPRHRPVQRPE